MLQSLIMKIRSEIDPPDQTCYQDQPSHLGQHRPTSTSCTKSNSVQIAPDDSGSPSCKHSSAAVSDSCLATTKAEFTVGAIATATQRYGTPSKRATATAQAGAAKHKSPSRSTVKPGALATLNAKAAAFCPSASHHRAAAPLHSIPEAEGHAAKTVSGDGHTKTAEAAAPTAADQASASRAAVRVRSQSRLPQQAPATGTAAHSAAAKQADSKSAKTITPSSSLPWDALAKHWPASANPGAASAKPGAASANPGAASANPGAASANPWAASAKPGAASANPGAASTSPAFAWPRPFQPPVSAKAVSGITNSTRPESTSVTLDQAQPAAAVVQPEAAWEPAAAQAVAAAAAADAASGMTASAASRSQVQGCSRNAPETSALRDVFNQRPLSDTAVPHALPAKPQPGKKKHAKPRVSCSVASQAESANSTAAGLGSARATSVQPHYSSSDNVHQHLASDASMTQNPACKIEAKHDLDSFKQVSSELRGSCYNKEECLPWDDAPFLQSSQPAEAEYIESFLQ